MDSPNVRVLISGYGLAGSVFHAPLIAATPNMRITGIVTQSHRALAQRDFPEARIYPTFDEALQEPGQFDLVVVATPNREHVSQALAAIHANIPVVVDKPLAPSSAEATRLIVESQEHNVALTCFQNRRWDGDYQTIQQLVQEDVLGPITRFESHFDRWRPTPKTGAWRESDDRADAGGLLFDLGAHLIDQAVHLFGLPSQVYAETMIRREGAQVDDDTFVALVCPNKVQVHLFMSALARLESPRFILRGLHGSYIKYGLDPQEDDLRTGKRPGDPGWGREPRARWGTISTNVQDLAIEGQIETYPGTYEGFYPEVYKALTNGGTVPIDPIDSLRVIQIIEAARLSAASHQVIPL